MKQRVEAPLYEPSDEISLRELYLIFRGGLVGIVVFTVLVAAAVFVYLSLKPDVFEATATVQLNVPTSSSSSEEAGWLLTPVVVGQSAYSALAVSPEVVSATLPAADGEPRELLKRLELRQFSGNPDTTGRMQVTHVAKAGTAAEAAELANAWAESTVEAVAASMASTAQANAAAAVAVLGEREDAVSSAREALASFAAVDDRAELTLLIETELEAREQGLRRADELDRLAATTAAQRDILLGTVTARSGGGSSSLEAQLRALVNGGALDELTARDLESSLSSLPAGVTAQQDLPTLVARARLDTLTAELAGIEAERAQLEQRSTSAGADVTGLRSDLAELERQASQLQHELTAAEAALASVAAIGPLVTLQEGMVSRAVRVLVPAAPPLEPVGKGRLTMTLAAALVAGLLATLVVFLRAAVRAPEVS